MTTITFDTLKFANRLKSAGIPPQHAEAEAQALAEVFDTNLNTFATKADLAQMEERMDNKLAKLELRIDTRFERIDGEMNLLKWMMGLLLAGVASLILKAFF